jgi:2-oxoglutarate ferredoxin oxidoreductase subunit alpha
VTTRPRTQPRFLQGNEAIARGALAAGCDFFAGYPITPASEITEIMSFELPARGRPFIQMEDEIASLGACLGASLAGARAMTATSGPGFSLMQENLGYGIITETPVVVVNVQRAGPSTGMPTNVAQGDVQQARWGTHGDHPAIVLCPSSVAETVRLPDEGDVKVTARQRPDVPPEWYHPYKTDASLVPDLADLGRGYRYHVTGLVHDEKGFPTRRPDEAGPFYDRLFQKVARHFDELQLVEKTDLDDARKVIIAYGCVSRSAKAAVRLGRERGLKVGLLSLKTLWPFPRGEVERALEGRRAALVPELNMGQLSREVKRVNDGRTRVFRHGKTDGTMITPDEILARLKELP